jgi:phospholipid transport system substrate-binding protein
VANGPYPHETGGSIKSVPGKAAGYAAGLENQMGKDIMEVDMIHKGMTGVVAMAILVLMLFPTAALSKEPMAVVKAPIDTVIAILNDSHYQAPGAKSAQHDEIWKTLKPIFDFDEISRRAVARHWRDFSPAQRTAFTGVFAQFLSNTYIGKIQGEYHNQRIVYLGQDLYSDRYAEVKTHIVKETVATPVNYRLFKNGNDQWRVYDIIVEGVSLVKNYRTQFSSILRKETPGQLIQQLKKKVVAQNTK